MSGWTDTYEAIGSGSASAFWIILLIGAIIIAVSLALLALAVFIWNKKKWNLRIEIKLSRSDGKLTLGEWAKGCFNAKRGVLFIKRPKSWVSIPVPVFDIRKYLQGEDLLTVMQVGPEDFRPVLNDSWSRHETEYVDEETGETHTAKESVLNIKVDTGLNKAWRTAFENAAKKAYSLQTFFTQFQTPIAIAIVIIAVFVGFAIIWSRLGTMCG